MGPGLDFVEKAEGQDFYPPQSMQALALADSLVRLGLSRPESLSITAFDISPRVLDHLERARSRAVGGEGYVLQLPRPREGWAAPFVAYWRRFGDAVAGPAEAVTPPASAGPLDVRAVRVRPEVVAAVHPVDLNVVYQRLDLPPAERFDLVVATNILVYYDTFEQCLALANVARMTAMGGLFLSNNSVLELPGSTLRSVGYTTVVFSDQPDDGEHVIFYRRLPDPPSSLSPRWPACRGRNYRLRLIAAAKSSRSPRWFSTTSRTMPEVHVLVEVDDDVAEARHLLEAAGEIHRHDPGPCRAAERRRGSCPVPRGGRPTRRASRRRAPPGSRAAACAPRSAPRAGRRRSARDGPGCAARGRRSR